jgi:hypothetical protein
MSLHFQLDIAFDLKEDISPLIISGLENLTTGLPLTENHKEVIPHILTLIDFKIVDNCFCGTSIFYFKKHYRYHIGDEIFYSYTFQLRQIFQDDEFYEDGYRLIAWFATISDTNGFVGYFKERVGKKPELLYFIGSEVLIDNNPEKKYKLSDFT